jgi:hypothetical protein
VSVIEWILAGFGALTLGVAVLSAWRCWWPVVFWAALLAIALRP